MALKQQVCCVGRRDEVKKKKKKVCAWTWLTALHFILMNLIILSILNMQCLALFSIKKM